MSFSRTTHLTALAARLVGHLNVLQRGHGQKGRGLEGRGRGGRGGQEKRGQLGGRHAGQDADGHIVAGRTAGGRCGRNPHTAAIVGGHGAGGRGSGDAGDGDCVGGQLRGGRRRRPSLHWHRLIRIHLAFGRCFARCPCLADQSINQAVD